jgi:hypothetical protein
MRIAVLGPLQVTGLHGPVEITAPKQRRRRHPLVCRQTSPVPQTGSRGPTGSKT